MDIGKQEPARRYEPVREPVPAKEPAPAPPEREPVKPEPEKVGA